MLYYVLVSHHLWGQEAGGASWERDGSKGSETNVILGFRVSTTSGKKKFNDHI